MGYTGNRLIGRLPKLGIRPTIDGRLGGIRESLEGPTLALARAVADLVERNVRHPSGEPVECVIPARCIGGVAEAAEAADLFQREGVGASLTITKCWCYGSETMDMDPIIPKAVWGFNGTERPGAVYLAAVLAAHAQKGLPAHHIYGRDVQDSTDNSIPEDVAEKILRFARAGIGVATMRGKSYLAVGGVSMGIVGSIVDQPFFEQYLGMRVETADMSELIRRMQMRLYDEDELARALAWVRANCREGEDFNSSGKRHNRQQLDADWETSVKMALIVRDMMIGNPALAKKGFGEEAQGHNALISGFQGQRQWTDFMPNGDFLEAILASSFDWNGIRQPYMVATENDAMNGASMLFGHLLTGSAQIFADVRTYWSPAAVKRVTGHELQGAASGGFLHLINSGPAALDGTGQQSIAGRPAMKPHWEITADEMEACLKATSWHPANLDYFRGGGFSTRYRTRGGMPCTILRLNLVAGLGPVLQLAEGQTIDLPEQVHETIDLRTDYTWPTTWFVPRLTGYGPFRDVYSVMNAWGSNHCSLCHGHVGADLLALASMLRIPVYMHNIEDEKIFRPKVWSSFGSGDYESADFRACAMYGALYR